MQSTILEMPISSEVQTEETQLNPTELETLLTEGVISQNPNIVSGAFVFTGTRVPVYNLWDYLSVGDTLDDFLESFPTVPAALAKKALSLVGSHLTGDSSRP